MSARPPVDSGGAEDGRDLPLVIFDCDGVLVETEQVSARVNQRILAGLGWQLELDEFADRFVGRTTEHFRAEVEDHLGYPLDFDWGERYGHLHQAAYQRELTAVRGIQGVLRTLEFPSCVASNAPHDHVRAVLAITGLLPFFERRIFSADDVGIGKPAPDLFLHAARTYGRAPHQCIVVEDSVVGVQAAVAAGMPVIGYTGGLTRHELLAAEATWTASSMSELPRLLHEQARALTRS
jgi:HAD superfamily hydrolase (TIGR01509 family)